MSACAAGNAKDCTLFDPVYPFKGKDILTRETKAAIVSNNEVGEKECGWQPVSD